MGDNFFAFSPSASSPYIAIALDADDSFYEAIDLHTSEGGKKPIEWEKHHLKTFIPTADGKQGSPISLSYNVKFGAFLNRAGVNNIIYVVKAQGPTPGYPRKLPE